MILQQLHKSINENDAPLNFQELRVLVELSENLDSQIKKKSGFYGAVGAMFSKKVATNEGDCSLNDVKKEFYEKLFEDIDEIMLRGVIVTKSQFLSKVLRNLYSIIATQEERGAILFTTSQTFDIKRASEAAHVLCSEGKNVIAIFNLIGKTLSTDWIDLGNRLYEECKQVSTISLK